MPTQIVNQESFKFEFQGKSYQLSFAKAFLFGDGLFSSGQIHVARNVFQALASVSGHGPRAKIMWARCEAALNRFSECAAVVGRTFEDPAAVEDLHTALVFQAIGMHGDAIAALTKLAARLNHVPVISLLLGDELAQAGDLKRASDAWTDAVDRDQANGEIAVAATRRLKAAHK